MEVGTRPPFGGDDLWDDIVYGVTHDLFENPVSEAALRAVYYGECDAEIGDLIRRPVRRARTREQLGLDDPFRCPRLGKPELVLGRDARRRSVGIRSSWLKAGCLIAGNTGSGKTNLIKLLLPQVAAITRGLWATDLYKRDLRHLRPILAKAGIDLLVLTPRQIRRNILQPEGDPRTHLAVVLDTLQRSLELPPRALTILRAALHHLYTRFGVFDGTRDAYPTLYDLFEYIRAATDANASARLAILDRLGALLVSLTPEVAAYRYAWRPRDLEGRHIVFEMCGASEQVKSLLLGDLLFSTLYSRVQEGRSNAPMDLVVVFEDAQRLLSAGSGSSGELLPIEELAGLIRGMGVSLWATCQSLAGLPRGLLANLATKVMCRLGTAGDYRELGADIGMTAQQLQWARLNTRPGVMITQLAEGPWRHPFVVRTPELKIPTIVSDAEVEASTKALQDLPLTPAPEFADWAPHQTIRASKRPESAPTAEEGETLTSGERRFLQAVHDQPGLPSSAYARLAGMGAQRAIRIRHALVEKGCLREHMVATGGRGRNAIVLEPTGDARRLFNGSAPGGEE